MNRINERAGHGLGGFDAASAGLLSAAQVHDPLRPVSFTFDVECVGPEAGDREEYLHLMLEARRAEEAGAIARAAGIRAAAERLLGVLWEERIHNTVTTAGKTDIVDKYFKGSAYTAAWYLGLKGTGSASASDTLASHGGWSEVTPYSGNRPAITFGSTSGGSNTASTNSYSITGSATVAGAFIASVNSGTSGLLYSAADFASSRTVANGDTLNVTPTVSVS
jgi:hypothetical protein